MTKLALIPFVIILIFFFISKNEKYVDNFNNVPLGDPTISILDLNQFKTFIQKDEDNFISNLSIYDLRARNMLNSSDYISSIVNSSNYVITPVIVQKIKSICNRADNIIKKHYIELYSVNWNIALFDTKTYEGGYPHTRLDIIFIPLDLLLHADMHTLIKTFIHEKIHILQRLRPTCKLITSFMNSNGFRKYKTTVDIRVSHPRCRSNPDLDEWIYCDDNRFYLCEYSKDYPDGIMDVIQDNNKEHPFEIMAYQISEELVRNM